MAVSSAAGGTETYWGDCLDKGGPCGSRNLSGGIFVNLPTLVGGGDRIHPENAGKSG